MDRNNYNTKQRDEIVEFFSRHRGSCFTAKDIITSGEVTVGEATVYRTLTKLANQGVLKRFTGDGSGACYQLMDDRMLQPLHLKCDAARSCTHGLRLHEGNAAAHREKPRLCGGCRENRYLRTLQRLPARH